MVRALNRAFQVNAEAKESQSEIAANFRCTAHGIMII